MTAQMACTHWGSIVMGGAEGYVSRDWVRLSRVFGSAPKTGPDRHREGVEFGVEFVHAVLATNSPGYTEHRAQAAH